MKPSMTNDELIGKLLALKRHEQPPAGYHTAFLHEFRRRQRAMLMRRSLALFVENLGDLWPGLRVPKLAYAAIGAVAVAAAGLVVFSPSGGSGPVVAAAPTASLQTPPDFSLLPRQPVTMVDTRPASARGAVSQHYVLQPRPASNERPLSF
jgi:hypothetical protein